MGGMPHPKSLEEAKAILELGDAHEAAIFDPANYPGFTPDESIDDLPDAGALRSASDDTIVSWALARRVALAHRHPTWLIDVTQAQLDDWQRDASVMPIGQRPRLAAPLAILNPPWAPLYDAVLARAKVQLARMGDTALRVLVTEFGDAAVRALLRDQLETYSAIFRRVNLETPPARALEALLAELRLYMRNLQRAEPTPRRRGDSFTDLK
jgi:hypothetical protein